MKEDQMWMLLEKQMSSLCDIKYKYINILNIHGLFCLQDLIIRHVTYCTFDSSHWLKLQHSDWREYFNQWEHTNL